jgi:hypothetical protein
MTEQTGLRHTAKSTIVVNFTVAPLRTVLGVFLSKEEAPNNCACPCAPLLLSAELHRAALRDQWGVQPSY